VYLLDTNHCSRFLAGDARVRDRIQALDQTDVSTSVIVRGELLYMAQRSERPADTLGVFGSFLGDMTAYHVDYAVAQAYGDLKARLFNRFAPKERAKRRHTTLHDLGFDENDLWIAATALRFGLIVVSSDSDFGRIAEVVPLQHEDWLTPDGAMS
jgi:tRNA(fMet)-specific endonuclease VapC